MTHELKSIFVDGQEVIAHSDQRIVLTNPATEEVIASVPDSDEVDVDRAVQAARAALPSWRERSPIERSACLTALAAAFETRQEEIARLVTSQNGSPITRSLGSNAALPLRTYRYNAELARQLVDDEMREWEGRHTLVHGEPVGVVGAIVPWNAPQGLISQKLGPALAAGCTVVLKPSPETSLDGFLLGELIRASGIPDGVVNIVSGGRATGEAIVGHPDVDKISFTGSTAAGKSIAATCGQSLKAVTLELGGKSAAILLEDVDIEQFRTQLIPTCLPNTGQVCYSSTRILAPRSRYDEVVEAIVSEFERSPIGDPEDPATIFGPLVTDRQRVRVEGYISAGNAEGARLVVGGGRPKELPVGYYVEPTLFIDVDNGSKIAREEIFGPVLSVIPYATEEEAIALANSSTYGLAGSVFSKDVDRALAIARRIDTGSVTVNGYRNAPNVPIGGHRDSGLGQQGGLEGFLTYRKYTSIALP